jgi:non-ribosomal peptide synthetase component E (peptide arylation enzyme)
VFAFVIVQDGSDLTRADLGAFLEGLGLARQKIPEGVEIVLDLPRTASGKVRKDQLRARLALGDAK